MRLAAIMLVCACSASSGEVTGEVHRFAIDRITVPSTNDETIAFAGDLDGNGTAENKLGLVMASLASTGDLSRDGASMIAAGALAQILEIQADDLANDDRVGIRWDGGEAAIGEIVDGVVTVREPGRAIVQLPIFTNAAPLALPVDGFEIEITAEGNAIVRGGVRQEAARLAAYAGLLDMFEHEPTRHLVFQRQVDINRDGVMSRAELDDSVIALLATADIQLFDGDRYDPNPGAAVRDSLSIGFGVHLATELAPTRPAEPCRDRVKDGDETDIDCGGACEPCWDQKACAMPSDCFSNTCAAGVCVLSTCSDGVRDAFESDVDCGATCAPCAADRACAADYDCASGTCDNAPAQLGVCR